ncbi:uncharacterized protein LOC134270716 [Saccostrea cucullata]|uniref:uncharacterized protein LOC134270716 n=1 Tax=Saccostrea cuccullata TaxID=36930 RepID=UPI002ED63B27
MWPPRSVLKDILNSNFHCVAIGSRCTTDQNKLEWRLSFSLAEQKLVYIMNHTQFLCYGLLKIFLSEVLNNNVQEPLLCSYFMKTTMFWLIQAGHLTWSPHKLMECFWVCFAYIIHCVYHGDFPNFFIQQNNMFLKKVVGAARESLLEQLTRYYRLGVSCVLQSPTLRSILEPVLSTPPSLMPLDTVHIYDIGCQCCINDILKTELLDISSHTFCNLMECFSFLKSLDNLLHLPKSQCQSLTLQCCTAEVCARIPFIISNNASNIPHKCVYHSHRNLCNILKLSSRIGTISHSLYLAMYYYRTGRYKDALHITNLTKERLSRTYIKRHGIKDEEGSREVKNSPSLSREMNISWITGIKLYFGFHYIEELIFEDGKKNSRELGTCISPFVLVDMLSVLSNYRLGNKSQYLRSLSDLHILILCDNERSIQDKYLSWYILGVCQQVVGDLHTALESYEGELILEPHYIIKKTIEKRIEYIHQQQSIFILLWYTCSLSYTCDPKKM